MTRQRTRKPTHPGIVFKTDVLDALDLSISKAADIIGISRKHLSAFVNGNVPCSKELAQRIAAGRLRIKNKSRFWLSAVIYLFWLSAIIAICFSA